MAISGTILAQIAGSFSSSTDAGDMTLALPGLLGSASQTITNGTGVTIGNADTMFAGTRTLNTATENLDLLGAGLLTPAGVAFAPARIKAILIQCNGTTAGNTLKIGGAANNVPFTGGATDAIIIPNGGFALLVAPGDGWVVTAATGDIITVETNYNGTYDILIVAATA